MCSFLCILTPCGCSVGVAWLNHGLLMYNGSSENMHATSVSPSHVQGYKLVNP